MEERPIIAVALGEEASVDEDELKALFEQAAAGFELVIRYYKGGTDPKGLVNLALGDVMELILCIGVQKTDVFMTTGEKDWLKKLAANDGSHAKQLVDHITEYIDREIH